MTGEVLIVGGGPAGLMAAEAAAGSGASVVVVDARPTVARKFLMAGKSGLNLTLRADRDALLRAYGQSAGFLSPFLESMGPTDIEAWANELGIELFAGSTGRVFPVAMKASPLLRAWLGRLAGMGVTIRTRTRFCGWDHGGVQLESAAGRETVVPDATVLACGGASWPRLGSDGGWTAALGAAGVACVPFAASNAGLAVAWSPQMQRHFGAPVKAVALTAGTVRSRGEFVVSARGLEGGGVYPLSPAVRAGQPVMLDLLPHLSTEVATARLANARRGDSTAQKLRKALRLSPVAIALSQEWGRPLPSGAAELAGALKALAVSHQGLRPVAEAISTVGGVPVDALAPDLMLNTLPGVFAAGEMIDWDAPTGGYLLTACLATGKAAGLAAARWAAVKSERAAEATRS